MRQASASMLSFQSRSLFSFRVADWRAEALGDNFVLPARGRANSLWRLAGRANLIAKRQRRTGIVAHDSRCSGWLPDPIEQTRGLAQVARVVLDASAA